MAVRYWAAFSENDLMTAIRADTFLNIYDTEFGGPPDFTPYEYGGYLLYPSGWCGFPWEGCWTRA